MNDDKIKSLIDDFKKISTLKVGEYLELINDFMNENSNDLNFDEVSKENINFLISKTLSAIEKCKRELFNYSETDGFIKYSIFKYNIDKIRKAIKPLCEITIIDKMWISSVILSISIRNHTKYYDFKLSRDRYYGLTELTKDKFDELNIYHDTNTDTELQYLPFTELKI